MWSLTVVTQMGFQNAKHYIPLDSMICQKHISMIFPLIIIVHDSSITFLFELLRLVSVLRQHQLSIFRSGWPQELPGPVGCCAAVPEAMGDGIKTQGFIQHGNCGKL